MKILLSIAFILCSYSSVLAQTGNEAIDSLIQNGSECLNEADGQYCTEMFDDAILLAHETDIDTTLVKTYYLAGKALHKAGSNVEKRLEYAVKGKKYAEEFDLKKHVFLYNEFMFSIYQHQGDIDSMDRYAKALIKVANESQNDKELITAHRFISFVNLKKGQYSEGIINAKKAIDIATIIDDPIELASSHNSMANLYGANQDFDLAKEYFDLSYNYYLEGEDTTHAMFALTNWCNVNINLGEPQSAIDKLEEIINYFTKHNMKTIVVYPMAQLAKAYNDLNQSDKAISIIKKAISISNQVNNNAQESFCHSILAESYRNNEQFDSAVYYAKKAYLFHHEKDFSVEHLTALQKYAIALENIKDYEEANKILNEFMTAKEKVFDKEKTTAITAIQEELQSERKDNEIKLLEKNDEVNKNRIMALVISLLLTALAAWLFIRQKSTSLKLKESENVRLSLELDSKNRELTSHALHLAQKNELLHGLKKDLDQLKGAHGDITAKDISNKIKFDTQIDQNWEQFTKSFMETKPQFFKKLNETHPTVGKNDMRLASLISMNLESKEIASILGISYDGIKKARYRLRKKLALNTEDNLNSYLASLN